MVGLVTNFSVGHMGCQVPVISPIMGDSKAILHPTTTGGGGADLAQMCRHEQGQKVQNLFASGDAFLRSIPPLIVWGM